MAVLERLFFLIYALAVLTAAGGVLVLCSGFMPLDIIWTNFLYLCGRWETAVGAAVFLLLSLRLIKVSMTVKNSAKRQQEAVVVCGKLGEVQIAVEAIRNMVDTAARSVRSVRDVKVAVVVTRASSKEANDMSQLVKITIKTVIGQEGNVVSISDQIRSLVQESLTNVVGLSEFKVEVLVDDISNAPLQKQRVV